MFLQSNAKILTVVYKNAFKVRFELSYEIREILPSAEENQIFFYSSLDSRISRLIK